jgi:hypothetical protein
LTLKIWRGIFSLVTANETSTPPSKSTGRKLYTMRLTADLIQSSLSYLNPLKERELDLRGAYFAEKNMILHFEAS